MHVFAVAFLLLFGVIGTIGRPVEVEERHGSGWTWHQLPGTRCADGSQTGFAISRYPGAQESIIYFSGGGACWDAKTCYSDNGATFITGGYTAQQFINGTDRRMLETSVSIFSRNATYANPYKKANYVFVPYCTGDLHGGDAVQRYAGANQTTYHHGYKNGVRVTMAAAAMLKNSTRVLVAGVSAGGFGSVLHYPNVQKHFPNARIDLLSDSASETPGFIATKPQWKLRMPTCPLCNHASFNSLLPGLALANPGRRFASLSWQTDTVLPMFFQVDRTSFSLLVKQYLYTISTVLSSNARTFMAPGENHGVTSCPYAVADNGQSLSRWLNDFHSG